jgi:NIMA-interacting peptidyl-prolyl cis-trans isomerase 1
MGPARSALALALASLLAACGGAPPPPAAEAPKPAAAVAPVAPAADADAAPKLDAAAVERCLASANATRAKFSGEPAKVTLKHVLVKHKDAKNPVATVTRSREEACLRAVEARDKVVQGGDFDAIVAEYSDEPGAATRAGSIGSVERAELEKPFADAAFELGLNQMSDVVETPSGFHLIFRSE